MISRAVVLCAVSLLMLQRTEAELYDWVNRFGGDNSSGSSIALDAVGNIYVAGYFDGTFTIGTNQFVSAGGQDIFLVKLNRNGEPIWTMAAGGTNDDSVRRIVVTTNGTVFMCGTLSAGAIFGTNALDPGTNGLNEGGGFVARVDDGVLSWIDLFAAETHGSAESLTLSKKDQSLWVFGKNAYQMFVQGYREDGTALGIFPVGEPSYAYPRGIAIANNGRMFVTGSFGIWGGYGINFGTTNLTANYAAQFTASLDATGRVLWAWSAETGYPSGGEAIALTPDGAVVSVGHFRRSDLPDDYAFIAKHSAVGTLQWSQTLGEFRGDCNATDVAVDSNGYILITGWAAGYFPNPASRFGVLLAIYDPNGNKLFEHHINSALRTDYNAGAGIASDAIGNIIFTGYLKGTPTFGTNIMGDGSSGVANVFVARRPTLEPTLDLHRSGTNFTLSWPRTGMPFMLQQSEDISSTNWPNVIGPLEEINGRKRITLSAETANQFFRLKMTNEVPIRHLPMVYDFFQLGPAGLFLGRFRAYVTASDSFRLPAITGFASDLDDDDLTLEWFNSDTGQGLTNGSSAAWYWTPPDYNKRFWVGTLNDDTLTLPAGTNTISLVAFDRAFHATNSVTIEVLSVPTAIDQLIAVVKTASTNSNSDGLLGPLQSAREAFEHGQFSDATDRLHEFQMLLADATDISDADKQLFNNAAQTILDAISSPS